MLNRQSLIKITSKKTDFEDIRGFINNDESEFCKEEV